MTTLREHTEALMCTPGNPVHEAWLIARQRRCGPMFHDAEYEQHVIESENAMHGRQNFEPAP